MKAYRPSKILIEKDAADYPHAKRIVAGLPGVPVETVEDAAALSEAIKQTRDPVGQGKRILLLRRDKGRSFKPFPEDDYYLSCDYFTLHVAEGCDLECSYCILQAYLNNPLLTVFVNLEEILQNLKATLDQNPGRFFRIGTGQLSDSLSLDPVTGFTETLVPFFARQDNAVLELKTKSTFIDRLLGLDPNGRTIVSWSLNSRKIQEEEEHKCATIEERIEAAKKVIAAGYRAGFHFDPIIDYDGWEKDYEDVIALLAALPAEKIAWISMGCLRFMPHLKTVMQERFPKSQLALAEWITGKDGKMRYFKPRRVEIYLKMAEMLRRHAPGAPLYLTMESPEVWRRVFGKDFSKASVCELLDRAGQYAGLNT